MYPSPGFNYHSQFCFKYTLYFFSGVFDNLILRKLVTRDVSRLYKNMSKHVWIANVEKQSIHTKKGLGKTREKIHKENNI